MPTDDGGKDIGADCPKLKRADRSWNPKHGTWYFALELPPGPNKTRRPRMRRGGFESREAAIEARDKAKATIRKGVDPSVQDHHRGLPRQVAGRPPGPQADDPAQLRDQHQHLPDPAARARRPRQAPARAHRGRVRHHQGVERPARRRAAGPQVPAARRARRDAADPQRAPGRAPGRDQGADDRVQRREARQHGPGDSAQADDVDSRNGPGSSGPATRTRSSGRLSPAGTGRSSCGGRWRCARSR